MWLKGLTLKGEIVKNPSVSLSPTLTKIEKNRALYKNKDP